MARSPVFRCAMVLLAGVAALGCGPRLVQPGSNPSRLSPPPALPGPSIEGPVLPNQTGPALDVGRVPRVPASSVVTLPDSGGPERNARYHTVQSGETITAIARRYGTTAASLVEANGLDQNAVIHPGQLIYVPE